MESLSLRQKLLGIVGLMWVGIVAVVVAGAWFDRSEMLQSREKELAQHLDVVAGIVHGYQEKVAAGAMTPDDAQQAAVAQLRPLRYGEDHSGYFGVYRTAPSLSIILLPSAPKLENTAEGTAIKDVHGADITSLLIDHAKEGVEHVSEYYWVKPGQKKPQPKMTYSIEVPEWNWVIYTGAYIDDIDAAFRSVLWRTLGLTVVVGALVTLAMMWTIGIIHRSLGGEPDEAAHLCRRIADGDLSVKFDSRANGKSLIGALHDMQTNLTTMIARIKHTAESITVGTSEIATGNLDLSQRTEEQASALAESASSMEHLTETVKQNAANAHQASELAHTASRTVSEGSKVVGDVVASMATIAESSEKIGQITGVIDGIAFQTNILALNAAVEAARAGEQGRGFAVVASEVRTLAQRSAAAAKEIKELIMASVDEVNRGKVRASDAGQSMDKILQSVQRVTGIMNEISAASDEQSRGIAQVGVAITQMDGVTQQNAALVEEAAASAASLASQAEELRGAVSVFRVAGR